MTPPRTSAPLRCPPARQRGIALYVVLVLVLMSMLMALWAARSSIFSEIVVGNDADTRRAFEAAQAMLQDAEFDIRGIRPDGQSCVINATMGDVCRRTTAIYLDMEAKELENTLSVIAQNNPTVKCFKGVCQKRADPQDFWNVPATLTAMTETDIGARYGQFTGADAGASANPILADTARGRGAWYWIEVMPYVDPNISLLAGLPPGSNVERFAPSRKKPFVYRITALARGTKASTEVVLQSTLSLQAAP